MVYVGQTVQPQLQWFASRLIWLPSFAIQVLILWQHTQTIRTLQVMPNGRLWKKPESYPLPASSTDHPVECHDFQAATILLANGLFLAGSRDIFYVKRRGCIRTTHGNVFLKRAKAGCHQREPSPYWNLKKTQQKDNVSFISAVLYPTYKDHRPYFLAQSAAWKIRVLYLHWKD